MDSDKLCEITMEVLKENGSTHSIPEKLEVEGYDKSFLKRVCKTVYDLNGSDEEKFREAIKDFIDLSVEFLTLQVYLERNGHYKNESYDDMKEQVYDNPDVMEGRYLNGLLFSQALWINHFKTYDFFVKRFCNNNEKTGKLLEVPVGCGFFITEFSKLNKDWDMTGMDISKSSVNYARKYADYNSQENVKIIERNAFDLKADEKYDCIVCGEFLEHLEDPESLVKKFSEVLSEDGRIFMTVAVWAAAIDHIYLFKSAQEVRDMLEKYFDIEDELVLNVFPNKGPEDEKTPINYVGILKKKAE